VRELESKLIVYTVLAITLGYVFVSTIPSQLAPPLFEAVQPEGESIRGPGPEEAPPSTEDTGETLTDDIAETYDSAISAAAAADAEKAAEEAKTAASGLTSYFPVFGTLIVNLTIAFAVYWLAKRRFT
jgi:hypothetical protein